MTVTFRPAQPCDACEHGGDHACLMLQNEVRGAVAEANGRAARHGLKMPPGCEVVMFCPAFWPLGRNHG